MTGFIEPGTMVRHALEFVSIVRTFFSGEGLELTPTYTFDLFHANYQIRPLCHLPG